VPPWVNNTLLWITDNAAALGVVGAALGALFPLFQYVDVKKSENKKHTFEAYHKLIGDIVDPPSPRLDRQVAAIFELRNFKEYFPVSIRILNGLRLDWITHHPEKTRLFTEIDLTLSYIKKRCKSD